MVANTTAQEEIDKIVALHPNWKGDLLTRLRQVVCSADDEIYEEVKWRMKSRPEGLAVWSYKGMLCRLEIFKNDAKLVFSKGALLKDAHKLFNARLDSSTERAIMFQENDIVDEAKLAVLVKEAVKYNKEKH